MVRRFVPERLDAHAVEGSHARVDSWPQAQTHGGMG